MRDHYDDGVTDTAPGAIRLTARGAQTRERIVRAATELMRTRGVGATTLDDVRAAGAVSKSQLYRHFADKTALVHAVIEQVGDHVVKRERALLDGVTSLDGLQHWRDALLARSAAENARYGCALGSLANEVSDQDAVARARLDTLLDTWAELFATIFTRFRTTGVLPADTDAERLSTGFLATVQGGYLLAQAARDVAPLAASVDMALDHLRLLAATAATDSLSATPS